MTITMPTKRRAKIGTKPSNGLPATKQKRKAKVNMNPHPPLPSAQPNATAGYQPEPVPVVPSPNQGEAIAEVKPNVAVPPRDNQTQAAVRMQPTPRVPASTNTAGSDLATDETRRFLVAPATIQKLRELQAMRLAAIKAQIRSTNAVKALVRRMLGWNATAEEEDREKVNKLATAIVAAVVKGKEPPEGTAHVADTLREYIVSNAEAQKPHDDLREGIEKQMEKIAKTLPVAPFVEATRGFGYKMLAVIVGEAGDLANYSNPGKLWKRFGMAPHQGKAASSWRREGGMDAEGWTEIGYSPSRRSQMFVVGDCLIKASGEYKAVYDARKAYELERQPDMKPIAAHRRAQRYMEKRLLRELWKAWRVACGGTVQEWGQA